jgi:hypothetical protein
MHALETTCGGRGRFNGVSHKEEELLGNGKKSLGPINMEFPHFLQNAFIGLMIHM